MPEPPDGWLVLVLNEDRQPEAVYIRADQAAADGGYEPGEHWFLLDPFQVFTKQGDDTDNCPTDWEGINRGECLIELLYRLPITEALALPARPALTAA
jgi:hypothetical protein